MCTSVFSQTESTNKNWKASQSKLVYEMLLLWRTSCGLLMFSWEISHNEACVYSRKRKGKTLTQTGERSYKTLSNTSPGTLLDMKVLTRHICCTVLWLVPIGEPFLEPFQRVLPRIQHKVLYLETSVERSTQNLLMRGSTENPTLVQIHPVGLIKNPSILQGFFLEPNKGGEPPWNPYF